MTGQSVRQSRTSENAAQAPLICAAELAKWNSVLHVKPEADNGCRAAIHVVYGVLIPDLRA